MKNRPLITALVVAAASVLLGAASNAPQPRVEAAPLARLGGPQAPQPPGTPAPRPDQPQAPRPPQAPQPPRSPQAPRPPQEPGAPPQGQPAPPPPPQEPGQPVNIQIDVTISAQGTPVAKTFSMTVADRGYSNLRSSQGERRLNVDARPTIDGGRIRLMLTFEHDLPDLTGSGSNAPARTSTLRENLNVVLENSKPTVVSQHADPASDRKVTVEVKATILK